MSDHQSSYHALNLVAIVRDELEVLGFPIVGVLRSCTSDTGMTMEAAEVCSVATQLRRYGPIDVVLANRAHLPGSSNTSLSLLRTLRLLRTLDILALRFALAASFLKQEVVLALLSSLAFLNRLQLILAFQLLGDSELALNFGLLCLHDLLQRGLEDRLLLQNPHDVTIDDQLELRAKVNKAGDFASQHLISNAVDRASSKCTSFGARKEGNDMELAEFFKLLVECRTHKGRIEVSSSLEKLAKNGDSRLVQVLQCTRSFDALSEEFEQYDVGRAPACSFTSRTLMSM
jgi:hypothetical protein